MPLKLHSAARRIAELLSRHVVVPRHLPREFGGERLWITPDAALGLLRRRLEDADPLLFKLVRAEVHPGDVVWDVGSNVGLFAFSAAFAAGPDGHVTAIEPDPELCQLLRRNARRRTDSSAVVEVLESAIASSCGMSELSIAARGRASNFISEVAGRSETGGVRDRVLVARLNLDALLTHSAQPDFVKIDVEGAEALVLKGAEKTLAGCRSLYCEVGSETADETTQLLSDAGFTLYDAETNERIQKATFHTLARRRERS
ncbi:MAG: FkbM family methyltransferase [Myxococcota bacterium]